MECRDVVVAHAQLLELLLGILLARRRSIGAVHHALVPQRRVVLEVHWASVQPRCVELLVTQRRLVELAQLLIAQVEYLVRGKGRLRLRLRVSFVIAAQAAHRAELIDMRRLARHRASQRVLVQLLIGALLLAAREALVRRPLRDPELLERLQRGLGHEEELGLARGLGVVVLGDQRRQRVLAHAVLVMHCRLDVELGRAYEGLESAVKRRKLTEAQGRAVTARRKLLPVSRTISAAAFLEPLRRRVDLLC